MRSGGGMIAADIMTLETAAATAGKGASR